VGSTLIVGLGNPGAEYAGTRHNTGFMVVDLLAQRHRLQFRPARGDYWYATLARGDDVMTLVKPVTYMNRSGSAVIQALEQFGFSVGDLVVVVDDFALPLGVLRLRPGGSDGGHNGLASIIYSLQDDQFARIRCGIRQDVMPPKDQTAQFVLAPFDPAEHSAVAAMIDRAADAAQEIQRSGLERAMGLFNGSPGASTQ
jgi:peptidyl-tRNA hydrolase, PTH1 family